MPRAPIYPILVFNLICVQYEIKFLYAGRLKNLAIFRRPFL
ncbi:hypothetical protein NEIELOOT_00664 [Neisseria elongata subsp. glycolytica ATCC 29315]|uniref:Uncharacterized protein n=1 Tax=Neisseria elongata subsp. glycolytica ATCC 29315 TaxID=546263 RepID=D4DNN1_NEIEG|nr:hypothetical protein NEIELOOT_00664 [Neisseria elongata subsp. glycolytica ATCC 29315]